MSAYPGGVACSFTVGKDAELVITLAWAKASGKSTPDYRPVVFDAGRKRYLPCQPTACGTTGDGASLSMAIWSLNPRDLPAEKVRFMGIEALKPEGRNAIAARAIAQAKEAEIEVLPSGQNGQPYGFVLTSMDGKKLRGSDLRDKVVLIDCWSSTCSPCLEMMPKLKAIYEKHLKDGLEIIGVSLDQDAEAAQKTCRLQGMTWPQVLVPVDEKTRDLWYKAAGLSGIPRLLLIDRDGILHTDFKYEQLEDDIAKLLERSPDK
jgi:thiol-disulfide isomerase/thioredoxin